MNPSHGNSDRTRVEYPPDIELDLISPLVIDLIGVLWARRNEGFLHAERIRALIWGFSDSAPNAPRDLVWHARKHLRGTRYEIINAYGKGYRMVAAWIEELEDEVSEGMRRPYSPSDPQTYLTVRVPTSLLTEFRAAIADPRTGHVRYGHMSHALEDALRQWLTNNCRQNIDKLLVEATRRSN